MVQKMGEAGKATLILTPQCKFDLPIIVGKRINRLLMPVPTFSFPTKALTKVTSRVTINVNINVIPNPRIVSLKGTQKA